mmetsp:Transcript_42775/g.124348  ORF Transcript_42775/g.124348 Transcript_42775/m.124348 type:complete len:298 (+) Transcript_42775:611-1504(+)
MSVSRGWSVAALALCFAVSRAEPTLLVEGMPLIGASRPATLTEDWFFRRRRPPRVGARFLRLGEAAMTSSSAASLASSKLPSGAGESAVIVTCLDLHFTTETSFGRMPSLSSRTSSQPSGCLRSMLRRSLAPCALASARSKRSAKRVLFREQRWFTKLAKMSRSALAVSMYFPNTMFCRCSSDGRIRMGCDTSTSMAFSHWACKSSICCRSSSDTNLAKARRSSSSCVSSMNHSSCKSHAAVICRAASKVSTVEWTLPKAPASRRNLSRSFFTSFMSLSLVAHISSMAACALPRSFM